MDATIAAFSLDPSTQNLSLRADRAGFILLGSFLLMFILIRISTRLMRSPKVPWWPGSIKTEGGLHVHHLVFGIVMMLLFGFLAIAVYLPDPWYDLAAAGFGAGAGLTLDEYALWLHLDDVYWADEGRKSVDAVLVAAVIGALLLLGANPLVGSGADALGLGLTVGLSLVCSVVAIAKGKIVSALIGIFLLPVSLVAAARLAKPGSPWARRRYPSGSARYARSLRRYPPGSRTRWDAVKDAVGGAPSARR